MKQFHYTAADQQGQRVDGTIEAVDWAAAGQLLAARGLVDCRQTGAEDLPTLSSTDAVELAGYLSELSRTGLPLGMTLHELAKNSSSPALRRAIDELTVKLEAGQPLDVALNSLGVRLPEHVRRLLVAAARSGRLSQALERLLEHQQTTDDMGRRLRQAVAYPAVLFALLIGWLMFVAVEVAPPLVSVLDDVQYVESGSKSLARPLSQFSQLVPPLLAGLLAATCVTLAIVGLVGGTAALSRLLAAVPLLGACWKYRGLADFSGFLAKFLDERLPLDEALALAATGTRDPAIRVACRLAAGQVAGGSTLAQALDAHSVFPKTLVRWVDWGQDNAALGDALRTAGDVFRERFELRLQLVRTFVPAIVFGLVAASALLVAGGVLRLLVAWINMLTYWNPAPQPPSFDLPAIIAISGTITVAVLGITLLVIARLLRLRNYSADTATVIVRFTGWVLIGISLLAGSLLVAGGWGLLGWLLVVVAWIRGALRYRTMQKQSLWAALSLAADKRVPLAPMARAFADEQGGGIGVAARELAAHLEAGANLAEAAAARRGALPPEAPLAARIGADSGDLVGALAAARGHRGWRPLLPPAVVWLAFFLPAALMVVTLVELKIVPSYVQIFDGLTVRLPPFTLFVTVLAGYSALWFLLGLGLFLLLILMWLQWRGTLAPRLPVLKRIVRWIELAPVLRLLALVTRRGKPLTEAVATLGQLHPRRWVRRRLRAAARDLEQGFSWRECLRRRRLLGDTDLAVLAAAERNGNLPWALEELGDSYHRRAEFQLKAWSEFALPLVLLMIGLVVGMFVVAYFLPLVGLIIDLS